MSLELSPETESRIQEYATHEGVTVGEAVNRLLRFPARPLAAPVENQALRILRAQLRDAENATPEEVAEAETEWLTFQRNMNANRQANGERLLYPEAET